MKSIKELIDRLNIKHKNQWMSKNIYSGKIKTTKIEEEYFIEEKLYNDIIRLSDCKLSINLVIPDGYLTSKEVKDKYNISRYLFKYLECIEFDTKDVRDKLFSKKSVEEFDKKRKEVEEYEKSKEWIKFSDIYDDKVSYRLIHRMKRNNEFNQEYSREFRIGSKKIEFIKASFYEDVFKGKYNKNRNKERGSYSKNIILHEDIEAILNNIGKKTKTRGKTVFSKEFFKEVTGLANIEIDFLLKKLNINKEKDDLTSSEINRIMNEIDYYQMYDLVYATGLYLVSFNGAYNNIKNQVEFKEYMFKDDKYISIDILEMILRDYAKRTVEKFDDIRLTLKERLLYFPKENVDTYEAAVVFLEREIASNKLEKREVIRKINGVENLLNILDEELYTLNNNEIIKNILNIDKVGQWPVICSFINYAKKNYFKNTRYSKQFGMTILKQYTNKESEKEIYDKETWVKYYLNLKSVEKHYIKAIETDRYAQSWLYCLLNLSVTWRKKNIIKSTPKIYLEEIGIYDFSWFKCENEFTLEMAETIINQIKFSLDGVIAFKNKKNLHFNIPMSLKVPTAIAFIICEIHRRREENDNLLYKLIVKDTRKMDFEKLFDNDESLLGFSNLKCTGSIITYGYAYAANKVGSSALAYKFGVVNRSHVNSITKMTNTTTEYMILGNLDISPTEYMMHILERGSFGFMYYKIFQNILRQEEFESLNQSEVTEIINKMKEKISALTLERISSNLIIEAEYNKLGLIDLLYLSSIKQFKYMNDNFTVNNLPKLIIDIYKNESKELLGDNKEFEAFLEKRFFDMNIQFDKLKKEGIDELEILENVFNGLNVSYTENVNCVFDEVERNEKCPHINTHIGGGVSSCIGCIYSLNTTYVLYEVAEKINNIISNLEKNNKIEEKSRVRDSYLIKLYL